MSPALSRRRFLAAASAAVTAPFIATCAGPMGNKFGGRDPFALGVASGEPTADGFVIWTRLAPDPLSPDPEAPGGMAGEPVPVIWEVAADDAMRRIVRSGTAVATTEDAHALHVEVAGLDPGRWYWYRFRAGDAVSAIGRTRTAPAAGQPAGSLRLAAGSCANWQHGYYSAYRHIAADAPDLVLFLGDYIYEYIEKRFPPVRRHSDGIEATDLRTYRNRYAQYRTDPDLQAAHAAAPWLVTWDDHEVQNDYAGETTPDFADPVAFRARRAAAYRAFWEHMPLRPVARPVGADMALHRTLPWGDLARLWLLDGRQHRSPLACRTPPFGGARILTDEACPERRDPARSLLGHAQEAWLADTLAQSRARWSILGQDVVMGEFAQRGRGGVIGYWSDSWNGYPAARDRLMRALQGSGAGNPIVHSGDHHSFWTNNLRLESGNPRSPIVASEFVTTSIASTGPNYQTFAEVARNTPDVRYFESRRRGYLRVEIVPARLTADLRVVSDVLDPQATASTLTSFIVEDGRPGVVS